MQKKLFRRVFMSDKKSREKMLKAVFTALFAALIVVSAFISIPLPGSPVPIVLQNMMPVLAAALLGGVQGAGAAGLFLLAGSLGLPVFAGGRGGMAIILGPTGGFLIGYFLAAAAAGFYIGKPSPEQKTPLHKIIIGTLLGFVLIYIPGIAQFIKITGKGLTEALSLACLPFLPGDGLKAVLTVVLAAKLRPVIARYLYKDADLGE